MTKVLGIVAEYNPLHKGHHYHLQTAVQQTGCSHVIIALSGNFVQRGEPAIFDKWTRAKMALTAGADLVLEIPAWFVLQSAENFARAGVALLAAAGANYISFGSEHGNLDKLSALATMLDQDQTQAQIRRHLHSGISYAAAVQRATQGIDNELAKLLNGPNNILAIEYLRAIDEYQLNLTPHTLQRKGDDRGQYTKDFPSASVLRKWLGQGKTVLEHIPESVQQCFIQALGHPGPTFIESYTQAIFYSLTTGQKKLHALPASSEGIENRISKVVHLHRNLEDLFQAIKTKRYPLTRIQRLCMQGLLQFHTLAPPKNYTPYARVLACSDRGKQLLSRVKIPLIYSGRDTKDLKSESAALLNLDVLAADIYNLAQPPDVKRDLQHSPQQ